MQVLEAKRPLLPYPATIRVKKVPHFDLFKRKERSAKLAKNDHETATKA